MIVSTSWKNESCHVPGVPFYCLLDDWKGFGRSEQKSRRERVDFLSDLRNRATTEALKRNPNARYLVNLESYYLGQTSSILHLINRYMEIDADVILGACVWARIKTRITNLTTKYLFYDGWAFPEFESLSDPPSDGLVQVSSVGSCFIFPAYVWRKFGFKNPEPFPEAGIYYNWLCKQSGLPILVDCSISFYRDDFNYDFIKRLRCSLGGLREQLFSIA